MSGLEVALWAFVGCGLFVAIFIFAELTCDNIAGAFSDALRALGEFFRP